MTIPASLNDLLAKAVAQYGIRTALVHKQQSISFDILARQVAELATHLQRLGISKGDRVAVWLPKQFEVVVALFAVTSLGAVFVPINPALKQRQVDYILGDSGAVVLVTTAARAELLLGDWQGNLSQPFLFKAAVAFAAVTGAAAGAASELAAILYTSGSTGSPKGVMLSHANICTGAVSVSAYLGITAKDRILCIPPLSFDYGLNQVITSIHCGATAVLHDYLLPKDVLKAVEDYRITGLPGVPPLWTQLADLDWPADISKHIRYITNTGGRMPGAVLDKLRARLPQADIYLMYGLTEAFRSTYLDPKLVHQLSQSIGKAIPYAEIRVVRPDGSETADDEPGELVHMGPLVTYGYWRDEAQTAVRFRPAPTCATSVPQGSVAVWSGDTVARDANGFLQFIARNDDMIKTSGYRVSPTEVEEVLYASGLIGDAVVTGIFDEKLGQAIVATVSAKYDETVDTEAVLMFCRQELPAFMVPMAVHVLPSLPRNPNGKLDRAHISAHVRQRYQSAP